VLAVGYGAAYGRYDYLMDRSLLSPRLEVTFTPADQWRITSSASHRALAPGAEEFLPPGDTGIWLPPQRTFSSLNPRGGFNAEETNQADVAVERDFGASTVSVRAFRQQVNDQLVTVFGAELPGQPPAKVGHYMVGNLGNADASGCAIALRTAFAKRLRGSIEYTTAGVETTPTQHVGYLLLVAPSMARPLQERVYDVATSLETEVPETATRVLVLYRVGNGFARPAGNPDASLPGIDSRFDVQVRQSLPFMNFSNAKWEMLLAVRNFFRESGSEQSVLDERAVVRPPKRVVGGVTLRF
jgi:outer membrane receptor protein involved in Fe transport